MSEPTKNCKWGRMPLHAQAPVFYGQDAAENILVPSLFVHLRLLGGCEEDKPSWDTDNQHPETWQITQLQTTSAPQNWKAAGILIPLWQGIEF